MADEPDLPDERPGDTPPPPAKKTPAKAAKKAPAKKAPAKKAPAKKAPAKKAPPKVAPVAEAAPPPPPAPADGTVPESTAAQEKPAPTHADDAQPHTSLLPADESGRVPLPLAVAIAVSLLAILLVRSLRRDDDD